MLNLAVFVGSRGRGSNLRAIYDAMGAGRLDGRIVLVVGSKPGAPALEWAREAGLTVAVLDPLGDGYDTLLLAKLREAGADTIALAGFLRRLPSTVVSRYKNRILNTHPALLPSFGGKGMYGKHVHEAVLAYGAKVSGCTVHFVDEDYDTGPVVLQCAVPVEEGDTPESLAARILPVEHELFVEALQLLAKGQLVLNGRRVQIGTDLI